MAASVAAVPRSLVQPGYAVQSGDIAAQDRITAPVSRQCKRRERCILRYDMPPLEVHLD
jgi:hypothetical protein